MDKSIYTEWVFHDVFPIYMQLKDKLKWAILSGQLQPGEEIPSIREMASILHINTNIAARVYKLIRNEGLLELVKGKTCRVISDNVSIQKIRAQEVQILCCDYVRGMMALGFSKEESFTFINDYIHRQIQGKNQ